MIEFYKNVCQDFKESSNREWLEANGLGGFASSTVSGANTRRYHGILVAAVKPPVLRMVLVNQYAETLSCEKSEWKISSHLYSNPADPAQVKSPVIFPDGSKWIEKFTLYPWPTWIFSGNNWKIEKSIFMVYGQNTSVTMYRLLESDFPQLRLRVRPLLTGRESHRLHLENKKLNPSPTIHNGLMTLTPYLGVPQIFFHHNGSFESSFYWYKSVFYPIEKERGDDCREDYWSPGEIIFDLKLGESVFIIASTETKINKVPESLMADEKTRRESTTKLNGKKISSETYSLLRGADQLIVAREKKLKTVIAGYPWFTDWGRDTFISIFGLCYAAGKYQTAKGMIDAFSKHINQGMIPNHFPDSGDTPHYNTVDASLWYFYAVYAYWKETGDTQFISETMWEKCLEILDCYRKGTRYNIHLDNDGLIFAGEAGTQLTWMDAKVENWVVTPRMGKPVEIQALWYNALNCANELALAVRDNKRAEEFDGLARWCKNSFNRIFWYERGGYCYDVIYGAQKDTALRPNQVFAISLPFMLLEKERASSVLGVVEKYLLTPYGLRSLSPRHPQYCGLYKGNLKKRDGAYHQGTVWSWLIGPYITAYLKMNNYSADAKKQALQRLNPLLCHLEEFGLGSISEIFDGDPPHHPRGCFSQAWSVAELLRILVREIGT